MSCWTCAHQQITPRGSAITEPTKIQVKSLRVTSYNRHLFCHLILNVCMNGNNGCFCCCRRHGSFDKFRMIMQNCLFLVSYGILPLMPNVQKALLNLLWKSSLFGPGSGFYLLMWHFIRLTLKHPKKKHTEDWKKVKDIKAWQSKVTALAVALACHQYSCFRLISLLLLMRRVIESSSNLCTNQLFTSKSIMKKRHE